MHLIYLFIYIIVESHVSYCMDVKIWQISSQSFREIPVKSYTTTTTTCVQIKVPFVIKGIFGSIMVSPVDLQKLS